MRQARSVPASALIAALGMVLAACQSAKPPAEVRTGKSASLRVMEGVATQAYRCWFASDDPAFRAYSFANELDSMSGQPRFLLVPARNFGGRPRLVVQAQGGSAKVEAFGPLLAEPLGRRVSADVARWAAGATGCGTAA